jgi:4a-hydroxytetrahydrobiopterin dehydratase
MKPKRSSDSEIAEQLKRLPLWRVTAGKLHREFQFDDFVTAFGFMSRVALVAEKLDHHPDWSNSYGKVSVDLVSHDAGGISQRDFDLASRIDAIAGSCGTR